MNLTFEKILAEAEKGDKDSQYELAYMYQFGRGTSIELKEAFKWYNKAANQGHKSALNILKTFRGVEAIESYEPLNEKFDNARAAEENTDEIIYDEEIKLLLAYAYKGNYNAQYDMGIKILSGIYENYGMTQSDKNKWISLVAENGDFDAQIRLSKFFINKNVKRSFKWTLMAAKQEDADRIDNGISQHWVGWMYANGQGTAKNYKEALKWYKKSANKDNVCAQFELGWMQANGLGTDTNYKEALKWYKKAAEKDYREVSRHDLKECIDRESILKAKLNLGLMYDIGKGVLKDFKEAVKWYKKAAKQSVAWEEEENIKWYETPTKFISNEDEESSRQIGGNLLGDYEIKVETLASIYHNLAMKYFYGEGVLKDNKKASSWLLKAAEKYDSRSQYMLFTHAKDLKINSKNAIDWLYQSAGKDFLKKGYAKSQYIVGSMYFENRETDSKNISKSRFWIARAYENSDKVVREKAEDFWNKNKLWQYIDHEYKDFIKPNDQKLLNETETPKDYFKLGKSLVNGDGVLKDPIKAIEYFTKASKNSHHKAETAFELGVIYFELSSNKKNIAKSKKWIEKAFESSNIKISKKAEDFWNKHELWKL